MPKKLSKGMTKRIVAMYQRCRSGYEVARSVGVAVPTVYGVLREAGIERTGKTGRARASDEAIIRSYRRNGSGIVTAAELRVSDKTVYGVLSKHGVETKSGPARRFDAAQDQRIAALYSVGWSASKIARRYRCSLAPVLDSLNRLGVERNRRSPTDLNDSEKAAIMSMWEAGSSFKEISASTGRTAGTVSRFLRTHHEIRPRPVKKGEGAPGWKGGRVSSHGYVYVWLAEEDQFALMRDKAGRVAEHRLVLARALGRVLSSHETVHHINGDRVDNRLENLQLRQGKHGKGVVIACLDCGSHRVGPVAISADAEH